MSCRCGADTPKLGVFYFPNYKGNPEIEFATDGSACRDLRVSLHGLKTVLGFDSFGERVQLPVDETSDGVQLFIPPHHTALVPLGIAFEIPMNFSVRLYARSSLGFKKGLVIPNSVGIIDSDYVNEVHAILYNYRNSVAHLMHGERVVQMELVPVQTSGIIRLKSQPVSYTRSGGFGSTGKH